MAGIDILASAMTGANATFLADLYARWVDQPDSVDASFQELFAALNDDARAVMQNASGASWAPRPRGGFAPEPEAPKAEPKAKPGAAPAAAAKPADPAASRQQVLDSIRALMLIRAYRVRGHLEAQLDPLHLQVPKAHPELDPKSYGFSDADLDRPIFIDRVLGKETATLREIIATCRASYCGSIGVEFMHIQDPEQKSWIQQKIEGAPWTQGFDASARRTILQQLTEAEGFAKKSEVLKALKKEKKKLEAAAGPAKGKDADAKPKKGKKGEKKEDAAPRGNAGARILLEKL